MVKVSKEVVVLFVVLIVGMALLSINARTFADPGVGQSLVAATNTAVSNYFPVVLQFDGTINPMATSTPIPSPNIVAKGEILPHDPLEVEYEFLAANEIHEWELDVFEEAVFTVNVAGDPDIDIIISVLDKDDNVIFDQQNVTSPNELEVAILNNLPVGTYLIQIETVGKMAGYYAVAVGINSIFLGPIAYKGILLNGNSFSSTVAADFEDMWFFYADAGNVVTISVAPSDNSVDMYLALFNDDVEPDQPIIEVDSSTLGATEEIIDYEILQNGVYMIFVADNDYAGVEYDISLLIE